MISAFLIFPVDVLDKVYILNIPLIDGGGGHETDILIAALGQRTQVNRDFVVRLCSCCNISLKYSILVKDTNIQKECFQLGLILQGFIIKPSFEFHFFSYTYSCVKSRFF